MLLMSIKCQGVPSLLFIKIWGKDTYFCSRPLLKPKEHERDNTCVLSQTQSYADWSGTTGRFS